VLLAQSPLEVTPLEPDHGIVFPEEGDDYAANAIAKAKTVARALGEPAVADDSGLEVDALDGGPGPRSARYGGPGLDDAGRVSKLLEALEGVPPASRGARFYCVAACAWPDGTVVTAAGACPGHIATRRRGRGGFGYDPIFVPEHYDVSMAELAAHEKDAISHRGRAFRALYEAIREARSGWLEGGA